MMPRCGMGKALLSFGAVVAAVVEGVSFSSVQKNSYQNNNLGYTVYSETFRSIPMDLAPGEMVFTETSETALTMPDAGKTGYFITGFSGEIVDEQNNSVPLSEVYDHHWIAVQASHENALCGGDPEYVVGIGAESRNTATAYPEGYGYYVGTTSKENQWGANIHLLRTVDLAGDSSTSAKECNECFYADTKGSMCTKERNGTFYCCGQDCPNDTCFCPTVSGASTESKRYYLRYQVNYTYDVDMMTPVSVGVFTTPSCRTYYAVYENNDQPESLASYTMESPANVEVVYAIGHMHVGALNISMYVNDEYVCTSYPRYGTQPDVAGDEYGYVVEMSTCLHKDNNGSYFVNEGDKIRLDAYYFVGSVDDRIAPHPGGTHLNVMAYMYLGYTSSDGSQSGLVPPQPKLPTNKTDSSTKDCAWWSC